MEKTFTLSVFTENSIGMLNRIAIIFTRRHLSMSSITISESEVDGIFRYTIVIKATLEQVNKVTGQIERLTDVLKTYVHDETETVHQEIALYKIKTGSLTHRDFEKVLRKNHARILTVAPRFLVIEKTGHFEETQFLLEQLKPFGVLEFARSGTVAVIKPLKGLSAYLKELK